MNKSEKEIKLNMSFKNGLRVRFLLIALISFSSAIEPHCSKFPYEEALLEKMVRMEFEVKQMRVGIDKVKSEVVEELNQLKEARSDMEKLTNKLSEQWTNTKAEFDVTVRELVENVTSERSKTTNEIKLAQEQNEEKIIRMSGDLVTLRNETIKSVIDGYFVPNVHFIARVTKQLSFGKDQTVIFDTIIGNDRDGYSDVTGVFTVPVSGNYIIVTQLCGQRGQHFEFAFMVNDAPAQIGNIHGVNVDPCWNSVMMRRLGMGDRVYVNSIAGNNGLKSSDSYQWNLFSGVLVAR